MPALLLDTGEVITETPLIIQAIAPQVYANTTTDLPNIAKAFGILTQGVRAFSTERFTPKGQELHPFVARSTELLQTTLPNLPALSADSTAWGDRVLMSALIWIGVRLPHVFETLSDTNKQAAHDFHQSPLMQKLNTNVLENQPSRVRDL